MGPINNKRPLLGRKIVWKEQGAEIEKFR